jgi:hypothetical protein
LYQRFLSERPADAPPIEPGKIDEKFWMKETIAMKRFYSICDNIMNPTAKRGHAMPIGVLDMADDAFLIPPPRKLKSKLASKRNRSAASEVDIVEPPTKKSRSRSKSKVHLDAEVAELIPVESSSSKKRKKSERDGKVSKRRKTDVVNGDVNSGDETDAIVDIGE